jgi:hypothetical protein
MLIQTPGTICPQKLAIQISKFNHLTIDSVFLVKKSFTFSLVKDVAHPIHL